MDYEEKKNTAEKIATSFLNGEDIKISTPNGFLFGILEAQDPQDQSTEITVACFKLKDNYPDPIDNFPDSIKEIELFTFNKQALLTIEDNCKK